MLVYLTWGFKGVSVLLIGVGFWFVSFIVECMSYLGGIFDLDVMCSICDVMRSIKFTAASHMHACTGIYMHAYN